MEAAIGGVAGIAVSLHSPEQYQGELDYGPASRMAQRVVERLTLEGINPRVLLNMNVPYLPDDEIKGLMVTRQGMRVYRDRLDQRTDPRGRPYYWIGGDAPTGVPDEGTDFGALALGYVSITPLDLDLTDYQALKGLSGLQW
jgi:5'-nucleotidase